MKRTVTYALEFRSGGGEWRPDRMGRDPITFQSYEEGVKHIAMLTSHAQFRIVATFTEVAPKTDAEILAKLREMYSGVGPYVDGIKQILDGDF